MEAALGFYRDLLGMQVVLDDVLEGEEFSRFVGVENLCLRAVFLTANGELPYFELIEYQRPDSAPANPDAARSDVGDTHPCILLDDLPADYERLVEAGVRFTRPPMYIDGGEFEGDWAAMCVDPDGQPVELWSRTK